MPACQCNNPACHALNDVVNQFLDTLHKTIDNDPTRFIAAMTVVARLALHYGLSTTQTVELVLEQLAEVHAALHDPTPRLEIVKSQ